jgi:hypothetical protein
MKKYQKFDEHISYDEWRQKVKEAREDEVIFMNNGVAAVVNHGVITEYIGRFCSSFCSYSDKDDNVYEYRSREDSKSELKRKTVQKG